MSAYPAMQILSYHLPQSGNGVLQSAWDAVELGTKNPVICLILVMVLSGYRYESGPMLGEYSEVSSHLQ